MLFFNKQFLLPVLAVWFLFSVDVSAETYIELDSRKKIKQPFLLIDNPNSVASVILFAGASGYLNLGSDGSINHLSRNFLVRSRQLFSENDLRVIVFEVPSHKADDFGLLGGYRRTKNHAKDIEVIVDYLIQKYQQPVWLIGTSRGSPSASNGAARLGGKISGVVLTSSLSVNNNKGTHVFDTPLNKITVPVFIAAHKNDKCHVTPPSHAKKIARKLKYSSKVSAMIFDGGDEPSGRDCGSQSEHGFIGIEDKVVEAISQFIKSSI